MASAFTHAFVGTVIGKVFKDNRKMPPRFWLGLAACAALPDLDVIGYRLGVPLGSPYGHRGFTHSLFFAIFLAWLAEEILFRNEERFSKGWIGLWFCFFLATASHGFLDAFTDGGHGIAFFWPFSDQRYFFPWRPINVSPLSLERFWGDRAINILKSEFIWVWIPTCLIYFSFEVIRKGWERIRNK